MSKVVNEVLHADRLRSDVESPLKFRIVSRDPDGTGVFSALQSLNATQRHHKPCLLYTSDAADDLLCVDLGGRRII